MKKVWWRCWVIGGVVTLITLAPARPANAQTNDPMAELLKMMTDKGMLTEQEAQKVRTAAEKIRAEQEEQQAANMAASASKWIIGTGIKNVELFGDGRFRFEDRSVRTPLGQRLEEEKKKKKRE